jgi:cytochrome c553
MRAFVSILAAVLVGGVAFVVWIAVRSPTNLEAEEIAAVLAPTGPVEAPSAYAHCASCHLHDGTGRPDGSIPRLNGQRQAILESKLHRLRAGLTRLPVMEPFARALTPKEIPEIARYLSELPESEAMTTPESAEVLRIGAAMYAEHCAACHGERGEGQDGLFASRLCGQYRGYMTRRLQEARSDARGEADAIMKQVLDGLPGADFGPVMAWLAVGEGCNPP